MKIVSYLDGTALWGLPLEIWRPDSGITLMPIINEINEKFQFQNAGVNQASNLPLFQNGTFRHGETSIGVVQFEIQNNGLAAICSKTEYSDKFLSLVYDMLIEKHSFKAQESFSKVYRSTISAEFSFEVDQALRQWSSISSFADTLLVESGRKATVSMLGARMLGYANGKPDMDIQFVMERRMGIGSGPNRLFSNAPLSTNSHVKLLEKYEDVFRQAE